MSWWNKLKCKTCGVVIKKTDRTHIIRLNTADGFHELEVCDICATFFDKSAEVLSRHGKQKRTDDEQEDD